MASSKLTTGDRNEIRQLIEDEKDRRLAQLTASDPDWQDRVNAAKRKKAVGRLGIDKELTKIGELDKKISALKHKKIELEKEREVVQALIDAKMPMDESSRRFSCPSRKDMCTAINDVMQVFHCKEMENDKTGKLILAINKEADEKLKALAKCETREDITNSDILN